MHKHKLRAHVQFQARYIIESICFGGYFSSTDVSQYVWTAQTEVISTCLVFLKLLVWTQYPDSYESSPKYTQQFVSYYTALLPYAHTVFPLWVVSSSLVNPTL